MVCCILCGKELKTERGYHVHLARTHKICDTHGRFSLMTFTDFFPLIEKKRWKKAETHLNKVNKTTIDDWIRGYSHALRGMIVALSTSHSVPRPYIVQLKEFSDKKIKEMEIGFASFSEKLTKINEFDAGYFQAWKDFTRYIIQLRH